MSVVLALGDGMSSRSNGMPRASLDQIAFWVEALHSFVTFTVVSAPQRP